MAGPVMKTVGDVMTREVRDWSVDGTPDRVLAELIKDADAAGKVDWRTLVDSTVARTHQHAAASARRHYREVGVGAVLAYRGRCGSCDISQRSSFTKPVVMRHGGGTTR